MKYGTGLSLDAMEGMIYVLGQKTVTLHTKAMFTCQRLTTKEKKGKAKDTCSRFFKFM